MVTKADSPTSKATLNSIPTAKRQSPPSRVSDWPNRPFRPYVIGAAANRYQKNLELLGSHEVKTR